MTNSDQSLSAEPGLTVRPLWRRLAAVGGPRALLAAVIVGVALRVLAVGILGSHNQHLYEFGVIGQNVVDGRGYSYYSVDGGNAVHVDDRHAGRPLPSAFMPPGYTVVVAGAERLGTTHSATIRILELLNVVAACATIVLAYKLGSLVFGARAGTWAAFAFSFYPVLIYQATQPSASNAYLPLDLGALYMTVRMSRKPTFRTGMAAGGLLGLVCLFRAEGVVLVPLVAAWMIWTLIRRSPSRAGRRAVTRMTAVFLVAGAAIPVSWMVRNTVTLGAFTPAVTTTSGFNLWIGNHLGASGSQKRFAPEDSTLQTKIDHLRPERSYELNRDRLYRNAAVHEIAAHPVATAERDTKKLILTLSLDYYDGRARNPAYVGSWFVLAALGMAGIVKGLGSQQDRVLLYGYLGLGLIIPTVFFSLARYRLSVEAPLLLFAGAAIALLITRRAGVGPGSTLAGDPR